MQVMVRRAQLNGDARMERAEVLSQRGDELQVKFCEVNSPQGVRMVKASETIPATDVFGPSGIRNSVIVKMHTQNRHALGFR